MLLQIVAGLVIRSLTVHDQEILTGAENEKRMVPGARRKLDALIAPGIESRAIGCSRMHGDDDKPWPMRQRHKGLRTERMPLQHPDFDRLRASFGAKDRQYGFPALTRIRRGERVKTSRRPFIY